MPKTASKKPAPDRAKTLTPADAKRLAAAAPSLLKVPARRTFSAISKRARHYVPAEGGTYCGAAIDELEPALTWAMTTCESCLARRVLERKQANNESAQRYHERKRAEKETAQVEATAEAKPVAPVPPSVQDDTRHVQARAERERESLSEAHVRPAQLVSAIEVMIASAHARRARDEKAGRPVDRFVWGQLEALRAVVEIVRLAAKEGA